MHAPPYFKNVEIRECGWRQDFPMLDSKQLKALGLRFGRALQTTIKTAGLFTIEHKSADRPIQQSFLLLNNMLREVGQFTFGFIDNQIILNNLLTTDASLQQLETSLLKRGITAITFEPGLTLGRYKKVIQILSTPTAAIEAAGGFLVFLDQNEIEGVRILPAAKNQKKTEEGDTIIETDSEAYIISKQTNQDQSPRDFLDSIDALLESGCIDPSTRSEVISNFAAMGVDGAGYGPLKMPTLVALKEGEVIVPASADGTANGTAEAAKGGGGGFALSAAAGHGGGGDEASSSSSGTPDVSALSDNSRGAASARAGAGSGTSVEGGGGVGGDGGGNERFGVPGGGHGSVGYTGTLELEPGLTGTQKRGNPAWFDMVGLSNPASSSNPGTFLDMLQASVQRSLSEEKGNPEKSFASLARILRNTGVDRILERFPASRRQELTSLTPEQLASEYFEDTALQLAGAKLQSAEGSSQKILIEEDAVRLLGRSLQATHMADRLAQKLTQFIQDFAVPAHIQEKIKEELQWASLNSSKKYARLMALTGYSNTEFRRLLELEKELVSQREMERASALASHYFDFLDDVDGEIGPSDLSRAPELFRAIPLAHVGFASTTAARLARTLLRENISEFIHFQTASALTVLAQSISAFEYFQDVLTIGVALESSRQRDPEKHKKCCDAGLERLLPASAIERILELYLLQRGDSAWGKTAATLLRFAAPASIENVFKRLSCEEDTKTRLALVRLAGQLGKGSIDVAHKYLTDERWYVVRNMCGVLADIKDPDLGDHIAPVMRHPDTRVQQAALKALVKSRTRETAPILAASLSHLAPEVLDEALDELRFLKDARAVADLESFISSRKGNAGGLKKAVQALGSIKEDEALYALTRLFRMEELDRGIRRAALNAISSNSSPVAENLLQELAANWGPLAEEARIELDKRKLK
jgi:HEAT repeat protein